MVRAAARNKVMGHSYRERLTGRPSVGRARNHRDRRIACVDGVDAHRESAAWGSVITCADGMRPSASPDELMRSSRSTTVRRPARRRLQRGADGCGAGRVRAAVARHRRGTAAAGSAGLGPGAVLGQGRLDRLRMINARLETVAEKPAFRKAFSQPPLPAAGGRVLRVVRPDGGSPPDDPAAKAKTREAAVLHPSRRRRPLVMAGHLRDLARPHQGPRRRLSLAADLLGDHHPGDRRGRPHPRPDADGDQPGGDRRLAGSGADRSAAALGAAGGDRGRRSWRRTPSRPRSTACRTTIPSLIEPIAPRRPLTPEPAAGPADLSRDADERSRRSTPARAGPALRRRRRPAAIASWFSGHGAGGGPGRRRPGAAGPAAAGPGYDGGALRAAVADRRPQGRRTAGAARRGLASRRSLGSAPAVGPGLGCSSAAAAPGPGWPAGRPTSSASPASSAWRSRCICPGRPEQSRGCRAACTDRAPGWCCRGPGTPSAAPAEIRPAIGGAPGDQRRRAARRRPRLPGGQGRSLHRGRAATTP